MLSDLHEPGVCIILTCGGRISSNDTVPVHQFLHRAWWG